MVFLHQNQNQFSNSEDGHPQQFYSLFNGLCEGIIYNPIKQTTLFKQILNYWFKVVDYIYIKTVF